MIDRFINKNFEISILYEILDKLKTHIDTGKKNKMTTRILLEEIINNMSIMTIVEFY